MYARPAHPLTTTGEELDDLDNDLSDLNIRGDVDHDLSVRGDVNHDLNDDLSGLSEVI